jgi:transcriptional regulator with XRE-family HTH domain
LILLEKKIKKKLKKMNYSQILTEIRSKNDWTQGQLAEVLGLSRTMVAAIELGKYFPSRKSIVKIAELMRKNGIDHPPIEKSVPPPTLKGRIEELERMVLSQQETIASQARTIEKQNDKIDRLESEAGTKKTTDYVGVDKDGVFNKSLVRS